MTGTLNEWKKKAAKPQPKKAELEHQTKRSIAAAAGTEYFQNRDPIYHVSEDFRSVFELIGARRAQGEYAPDSENAMNDANGETQQGGLFSLMNPLSWMKEETPGTAGVDEATKGDALAAHARFHDQTSMSPMVERSALPPNDMFLKRFSETALQRGTMSGAILRGSGKLMLFSCLKRTVGQSQPATMRQKTLFEGASARRNVKGFAPDKVMFNRGAVDGAVGIVVDALKDARRTVNTMEALASGEAGLPAGSGAETLNKMYPFLSNDKERDLLAAYKQKLADTPGSDAVTKDAISRAITKTTALLEKKAQMKDRFMFALRTVSDRATEALSAFEQPGFSEELYEALLEEFTPDEEDDGTGDERPDDNDNEGGE